MSETVWEDTDVYFKRKPPCLLKSRQAFQNQKAISVALNNPCHFFLVFFRKCLCAQGGNASAATRDCAPEHTEHWDF